MHMFFIK